MSFRPCALLLPLLAVPAAAAPATVNSFETPDEIAILKPTDADAVPVRDHATDGKQALKVTFRPAAWPNVKMVPSSPWNWRGVEAIALDLYNPESEALDFNVRIDDDPTSDGVRNCRTGGSRIGPGESATFLVPFSRDPMAVGMRGLPRPAGARVLSVGGSNPFDTSHIVAMQIFLAGPKRARTLVVDNVRTVAGPAATLEGIVDPYGQYTKDTWPGKLNSPEEWPARRAAEESDLAAHPALPQRNRYGGWTGGPQLKATGFFRTEKYGGKWWLVDPEGRLFLSFGINEISPGNSTIVTGREYMFTGLPAKDGPFGRHYGRTGSVHSGPVKSGETFNHYGANLQRKYGGDYDSVWLETTLRRLSSWGFNTVANWSDARLRQTNRVAYVATIGGIRGDHARVTSGSDYWGKMHDPYDPKFAAGVNEQVAQIASAIKDDPWCLGYFVDNELSWGADGPDKRKHYGLIYGALSENAAASPAKRAILEQLKAQYTEVGKLNAAWGTTFASWEAMDAPLQIPGQPDDAMSADLSKLLKNFALQYFRTVRDAVRKADPNHLYMGCRFAWRTPEAIAAAAEATDVLSFNIYKPRVDSEWDFLKTLDRPTLIGEFHFGALDRGMFHTGLVAATDQANRAAMYRDYIRSVADHPNLIGAHWFRYTDEPLTGRSYDGENYNIGFLTVTDTPYPEMVEAARSVHAEAYARRLGTTGATR